jgi:hypothetical protein
MHTLITFASAPGPHCKEALADLKLPNLARLLQLLTPGAQLHGQANDLTPIHERVLAQAAGLSGPDGLVPWAAHEAQRLGHTALHGTSGWAWITPCHWKPQSNQVDMTDPVHMAITPKDADALFTAMQPYFAEDGITLFAPTQDHPSTRWLAHGAVFVDLPTASLDRVAGQSVDAWMPRTAQAQALRRLQNEMQMLLYTHPVNDQRTHQRLPIVNAFWASGTGTLSQPMDTPTRADVYCLRDALRAPALQDDAAAWAMAWHALDASTLAHDVQRLQLGESVAITLCSATQALTLEKKPLGMLERMRRRVAPLQPNDLLKTL